MYNFKGIEDWAREFWVKNNIYKTNESPSKKFYILEMYPYPSGDLHVGHVRNYAIGDSIARLKMMEGYDCLHPFGWDSFGLPAEEAAIKRGISPEEWTENNISKAKETIKLLGMSYDWDREIKSSSPNYYKWTQWLFLKLFEHGLAYKRDEYVNWCPLHQTSLANEQVIDGKCWRCGTSVEKKKLNQWFLKITAYAERLLDYLDELDWPDNVKTLQRNWIGKSVGTEIDFESDIGKFSVFTTRADTLYGVTFIAIAPENELVEKICKKDVEIQEYVKKAMKKSEAERAKEKTGIFTGEYAKHPLTGEKIPIWVADYVLPSYGTGIIMGVPAHDERDYEFAKKYNLPIKKVIDADELPYTGEGKMINSSEFDGLYSTEGRKMIEKLLEDKNKGRKKVNYRLRDWLISRQRYWGCPIPIVYCNNCGIVGVHYNDLPVCLPREVDFMPKGKPPLASNEAWVKTRCPKCNIDAIRETETMDTFVDSSWYWIRYVDNKNENEPVSYALAKKWLPIDLYIGGIEHATGHLIYFRFISHFLYDIGLLPTPEPCKKLFTHGMIMDKDGKVMSKSKGNVVEVGVLVNKYGADATRLAILFLAPPILDARWNEEVIKGVSRFLNRVYNLITKKQIKATYESKNEKIINDSIKKVKEGIENFTQNTSIASIMELTNLLYKENEITLYECETLLKLLAPFAPHLSEYLWHKLGHESSIIKEKFPEYKVIKEKLKTIIVEVNGNVRGKLQVDGDRDFSLDEIKEMALSLPNVKKYLDGKRVEKVIYITNKLVNFVCK